MCVCVYVFLVFSMFSCVLYDVLMCVRVSHVLFMVI